MREELLEDITNRKGIAEEMQAISQAVGYFSDANTQVFGRLSPYNEGAAILVLRDIAQSLRMLIELQLEHLSEHGS